MMPDHDGGERDYICFQKEQQRRWESLCLRCGACCGAFDGDPCEHLQSESSGRFFCRIYEERFGIRKTVGGRLFRCLPIREILHDSWPGREACAYVQRTKNILMEE
ncbi:MAG TPA: hypothetical protein PLD92_08655 [Candidatus Omnitrophota bacterium]|nr:hypothetical protein [Candidatus Omnitrophota bacterium]